MNKIIIYGLVILILLVIMVFSDINDKTKKQENFLTMNNDPDNDGKMTFEYLNSPNYTNNVLSRYYINDDKKINGTRIIQHPYQNKYSPDIKHYFFGNLYWNPLYSDYLYNTYSIRL